MSKNKCFSNESKEIGRLIKKYNMLSDMIDKSFSDSFDKNKKHNKQFFLWYFLFGFIAFFFIDNQDKIYFIYSFTTMFFLIFFTLAYKSERYYEKIKFNEIFDNKINLLSFIAFHQRNNNSINIVNEYKKNKKNILKEMNEFENEVKQYLDNIKKNVR